VPANAPHEFPRALALTAAPVDEAQAMAAFHPPLTPRRPSTDGGRSATHASASRRRPKAVIGACRCRGDHRAPSKETPKACALLGGAGPPPRRPASMTPGRSLSGKTRRSGALRRRGRGVDHRPGANLPQPFRAATTPGQFRRPPFGNSTLLGRRIRGCGRRRRTPGAAAVSEKPPQGCRALAASAADFRIHAPQGLGGEGADEQHQGCFTSSRKQARVCAPARGAAPHRRGFAASPRDTWRQRHSNVGRQRRTSHSDRSRSESGGGRRALPQARDHAAGSGPVRKQVQVRPHLKVF